MAIIDISKRPTIANPVLRAEQMRRALEEIDENIEMLYCVHFTMNGSEEVTEGMIGSLNIIHNRLRRLTDGLFASM